MHKVYKTLFQNAENIDSIVDANAILWHYENSSIHTFTLSRDRNLNGPLSNCDFKCQNIIPTSDPYNVQVGIADGTLSAVTKANTSESILVIHARGESMCCHAQMYLGKALTCLPQEGDVLGHPVGLLFSSLKYF